MEETIGYEALFSSSEWNAITTGDWSEVDQQAADEFEGGEHETCISAGRGSTGHLYDVWCKACEHVAPADTLEQAQAITRLHEAFFATLADEWDIDRAAHQSSVESDNGSFTIVCCDCGSVGSANERTVAKLLARLHERAFELASEAVAP